MNRKISFTDNEFYHLYSRGVDKRIIFLSNEDKTRFQRLLYICNHTERIHLDKISGDIFDIVTDPIVDIGAYCLMDNHFHILIKQRVENGISKFMQKLLTSHSMYFNRVNKRTGALFQSRFKSKYANNDIYLRYLFAYIHLNPIKIVDSNWKEKGISNIKKAKMFLQDYSFSSFQEYSGKMRKENKIINSATFPVYFKDGKDFEGVLDWWIKKGEV